MATAANKKRWDSLHQQLEKAEAAKLEYELELVRVYGASYQSSWLKPVQRKKLDALRDRVDKVGDKIYKMVAEISPRNWSSGVPAWWVRQSLTWEDAIRPANEPLSVVPPGSYGYSAGYVKEITREKQPMNTVPFESWADVLEYAKTGEPLYYSAPMDRFPARLMPGGNAPFTYKAQARTIKIWPAGSVGRGRNRTSDPFTADAGHLERFSRPEETDSHRRVLEEESVDEDNDEDQEEEVGHIGDVNWPEFGGGPIFEDANGNARLEYVEPPTDDVEFDDPSARWTIYRVDLDSEPPSWGDVKAVAQSAGISSKELRDYFTSDDPIQRALGYETWARYYGWVGFDQYPLQLTCAEMNERYDADLDCGSDEEEDDLEAPRVRRHSRRITWERSGGGTGWLGTDDYGRHYLLRRAGGGQWNLHISGRQYGPFDSLEDAKREAVAHAAGHLK